MNQGQKKSSYHNISDQVSLMPVWNPPATRVHSELASQSVGRSGSIVNEAVMVGVIEASSLVISIAVQTSRVLVDIRV